MTTDDDSRSPIRKRWGDVKPKDVMGIQRPARQEPRPVGNAFQEGASVKVLLLMSLPWFISIGVMVAAVLTYFWVHDWPAAFTESVLAIIVFGAGGAGGSMSFSRLYKYKVTHAS